MEQFDFDLESIFKIIKDKKCKTVGLQFPEGFKRRAPDIARDIEERTGACVIISGNPCFGACDVDTILACTVDVLFHFGHAGMGNYDNVIFIETRSNVDVLPALMKALPLLKTRKIGIITTVQHVHKLEEISNFLKDSGKTAIIGKGDLRIGYAGQVLGCNFSAARVDCEEILYVGSGFFHPLGAAIATGKRVIAADPYLSLAAEVVPEKFLRQRSGHIARAMSAKVFGIIVSTKSGQNRITLARRLADIAGKHGIAARIILMDLVTPEQLLAFKVDAYVNTACPRITIDDRGRFHVPVLTPQEFEVVLGEKKIEGLEMDEIREET